MSLLLDLGLPAAVLAPDARIIASNSLLDSVCGQIEYCAFDRLALTPASSDALLKDSLRAISANEAYGLSISLRATDDNPPAVAHVLPMRGAARDLFGRALAILVVTPLAKAAAPSAEILGGLFDLTPAEARVARRLAAGKTLEDIALEGSVTVTTVRNQLKSVLSKTGTNRQAELVRLLVGAPTLSGQA